MPNIVSIFPNQDDMPKITLVMMDVADFVMQWWLLILWIIIVAVIAFLWSYRNILPFKRFIDNIMVTAPIISPVIKWNYMYKFAKLLAQFYAAWMSPVVSLQLIWNIFSNYQYKKKVIEIRKDLESWFSIFEWMEWSQLFDSILIQIIHVWESTWTTKTVLAKISWFYKMQLENKIDIMMTALEPIMMIFIAAIIWSIVAAIMLPMASVVNTI